MKRVVQVEKTLYCNLGNCGCADSFLATNGEECTVRGDIRQFREGNLVELTETDEPDVYQARVLGNNTQENN